MDLGTWFQNITVSGPSGVQVRAASGGKFRRGESIEGLDKAYMGIFWGYKRGIQGLCKAPLLVTPLTVVVLDTDPIYSG